MVGHDYIIPNFCILMVIWNFRNTFINNFAYFGKVYVAILYVTK